MQTALFAHHRSFLKHVPVVLLSSEWTGRRACDEAPHSRWAIGVVETTPKALSRVIAISTRRVPL